MASYTTPVYYQTTKSGLQSHQLKTTSCILEMQFKRILHTLHCVATMLLLLHPVIGNIQTNNSLDQQIVQQLEEEHLHGNAPLKRKRRYLEFPEGSSFQLVYDLIVGIVDYTNYLILGVTVALAWELPSKPPSEILNDLTDRLKDGTLGTTRNDTITNIKYVDTKAKNITSSATQYYNNLQSPFRPPMHWKYYDNRQSDSYYRPKQYPNWQKFNSGTYSFGRRKDNFYYSPKPQHPFKKWMISNRSSPRLTAKYPWWNLPSRLNNYMRKHPMAGGSRRFDTMNYKSQGKPGYAIGTGRAEHRIFPIFGKRSIPMGENLSSENVTHRHHRRTIRSSDSFSRLDRIHIHHHRRTRHDLYERIETYLEGRGSNGHHCVLRALCETGQKQGDHEPGSFVGELMRTIFTLPEAFHREHGHKELRYDAANAHIGDCATRYHLCKDSLWSSHFVM
ncbi:uncharacterized protein LOC142219952 [Haematobia irritans]|uniref:uncharacterized protein LOC142219952 n=1 Tax=Haematobia irritans TaxID=7368 RepID=UPI003F4F66ED